MPSEKHHPFTMEWFDVQKAKSNKPQSFVAQFIHDFGNDTLNRFIATAALIAENDYMEFNAELYSGTTDAGDTELKWAIGRVMIAGYLNRKAWRDANGIAPSFGEFKNWLAPKARADWIGDYDFGTYEISTLDDEALEDDDDAEWQAEFGEYDEGFGDGEHDDDDDEEDEVVLNIPKWMPNG